MSDPFDELRRLRDQGLDVTPIPASEIRRRGDRLRRRNHAVAAVAGVAAIALVAIPLSLVAHGNHHSAPDPAKTPSPSPTVRHVDWLHEIPADFPLDEGLGLGSTPASGPGSGPAVADLTFCGVPAWSPASDDPVRAVDVTGVAYRGESEDTRSRRLALYTDDAAAQTALDAIRSAVNACPRDPNGSGAPLVQDVVATGLAADDSVVFTQESVMGGGLLADLTVFQVARVGNALYVATQYTAAGGRQVADSEVQRMAGLSAPVISDMCVFAAEPCSAGTGEGGAVGAIPADFPLLDGYPADDQSEGGTNGRKGPSATLEPLVPAACGTTVPVPEHVDLLRAGWTNPEDFRERQLVTFVRSDDAQAYEDALLAAYRSCPREDTSDGYTSVTDVLDSDLGESSGVAVTHYEREGSPAIGLATVHVVRVGRAVLVSTTYNEGGGGPDPTQQAQDAAAESGAQLSGVVPAMCVFTDDGC